MDKIGVYAVPVIVSLIVLFGFLKKVPIFDTFLDGAQDGMRSTASITPALVGLITSVNMLKASGALDLFTSAITPLAKSIGIPPAVMPLFLLRPVSGSGSIAILDSIFTSCGVDSFSGRLASVMMGSSETTFYAIAVYFGAVGIKNTRHAIPSALSADLAGLFISLLAVNLFFAV